MYFSKLLMHNDGPIEHIEVEFPIADGVPHPVIIVGENGVGKTNLLSVLADAIIESAAQSYDDIVNGSNSGSRSFFRYVGGNITKSGTSGYLDIVQLTHDHETINYSAKSGSVDELSLADGSMGDEYWGIDVKSIETGKNISLSSDLSKDIHKSGVYAFSPVTRNELPHWFNSESVDDLTPHIFSKVSRILGRKIIWEEMLPRVSNWIIEVILDSRYDLIRRDDEKLDINIRAIEYQPDLIRTEKYRSAINKIIQVILDDDNAQVFWRGRLISGLVVDRNYGKNAFSLGSLSAGQATLFSLFGTLVMYADECFADDPFQVSGSVIVDEIDSHLHIDLVNRALPQLIRYFPNVQFILSSHSPFFIAGMHKIFGANGLKILKLPEGEWIDAEDFKEFDNALNVFRNLTSFKKELEKNVLNANKAIVYCEGVTDVKHIKAAGKILGYSDVLGSVELREVGDMGRGSGEKNLKKLYDTVKDNATLTSKKVFVIFDNDVNYERALKGNVRCYIFSKNENNRIISKGIENVYPDEAIIANVLNDEECEDGQGYPYQRKTINKVKFADHISDNAEMIPKHYFSNFKELFEEIEKWLVD
ncbi:AAA family ATPase [Corynebacterium durum]|uniref:AAA family ATPase n=1 Tax=Corynebacterium durum TaxID=61592 RepID=UPI00389A4FC9